MTLPKQHPTYEMEQQYNGPVCGIDEVGRGPLAGPVMAACAYIPQDKLGLPFWEEIKDSKKLSKKKREQLFPLLIEHCLIGIAEASREEIDTLNIHHATLLAMKRAYEAMLDKNNIKPVAALIDGKFAPDLDCLCETVTKGDNRSFSIAAAAIVAKVTRDRIMTNLHNQHPHYGWERNSGYGTAEHMAAIKHNGITEHHRHSFSPVRAALEIKVTA